MVVAGIDIGSLTSKAVVLQDENSAHFLMLTGTDIPEIARSVTEKAAEKLSLSFSDIRRIISTGYGRASISFAEETVSEITCNAVGVHHFYPDARLVIDIGGQDSKAIQMNEKGKVVNFVMNDKCAAGTGKFLEVAAETLGVTVGNLADLSEKSTEQSRISSTCAVFAQTEIVSLIARQTSKENIVAGLHEAIVSRVCALINSLHPGDQDKAVMTGGVAKNRAIVQMLQNAIKREIIVPEEPQVITAFGAALMAKSKLGQLRGSK